MISDAQFTEAIEKLFIIGRPGFFLGDRSKGWDCLNSLHAFYRAAGVEFPDTWRDYTEANYPRKWKEDEARCRDDFKEFLMSLGREIENPGFAVAGDLLLFEAKKIPFFPAIYLGNGKMIMVFKEGVLTLPYNKFKPFLKQVRRLIS